MKFDWDSKKASSNKSKHGILFEDAITAFDDPYALIERDEEHSTPTEIRELLIGESEVGVLVVIFTIREKGHVYRVISARKANKKERRLYEEA
ncbi:MAG: BrnT family toxin [Xanthomonadaceae bacterium]|nr:BrnT family toxin [Xanthomonadaceae bacterium]